MVIGRGVVDEKENLSTTFVEIQKNRSEMLRNWKTYPHLMWKNWLKSMKYCF
jgi:hypothetical protein